MEYEAMVGYRLSDIVNRRLFCGRYDALAFAEEMNYATSAIFEARSRGITVDLHFPHKGIPSAVAFIDDKSFRVAGDDMARNAVIAILKAMDAKGQA